MSPSASEAASRPKRWPRIVGSFGLVLVIGVATIGGVAVARVAPPSRPAIASPTGYLGAVAVMALISVGLAYSTRRLWRGESPMPWRANPGVTSFLDPASLPLCSGGWCLTIGGAFVFVFTRTATSAVRGIGFAVIIVASIGLVVSLLLVLSILVARKPRRLVPPRLR